MDKLAVNQKTYDFRIVKDYDLLVDQAAGGGGKSVYALYECHYHPDGRIKEMCLINDMTCWSRADAADFLLRISAAMLKPVLDSDGQETEAPVMEPGKVILNYINKDQ